MARGLFITLEGLDGCGKTTQIKLLEAWLHRLGPIHPRAGLVLDAGKPQERGTASLRHLADERAGKREVILTRQPGGTTTGDRIRALVLDSRSSGIAPMTEMALMFADRAQTIAEVIQPALERGKIVLCDRFTDSTEAYQGGGRQLGSEAVLELHRLLCGNLQPDLTFLLLPSLELSLARARRRNERAKAQSGRNEGRFEAEQDAFHSRVWRKYREIATRDAHRVALIEGDLTIGEVHDRIVAVLGERLPGADRND